MAVRGEQGRGQVRSFRGLWLPAGSKGRVAALLLAAAALIVGLGVAELALRAYRDLQARRYVPVQPLEESYLADQLTGYRPPSFRGVPLLGPKPPGSLLIVVLGGSTVLGIQIPEQETIPAQLGLRLAEQGFPNTQVLNAGVRGYTSWREYLFYEAYLRNLQPDVVIQLNGLNDLFYSSLPEWLAMLREAQLLAARQPRATYLVTAIDEAAFGGLLLRYHLESAWGLAVRWWRERVPSAAMALPGEQQPRPEPRVAKVYRAGEELLARAVREDGGQLLVASQPLLGHGGKRLTPPEQRAHLGLPAAWRDVVGALYPEVVEAARLAARQEQVAFVDLSTAFDNVDETAYLSDGLHYTALGSKLLSDRLAEKLVPMLARGGRAG